MIRVIREISSFRELKDIWGHIYESSSSVSPFLKFDYVSAALDFSLAPSDSPYIVCVKDAQAKEWIAIFPFILNKNGILNFINAPHTDFCGALINQSFCHYNLFDEFADFIKKDDTVKGFVLENINSDNPLISVLKPYFAYYISYSNNYFSTFPIYQRDSDRDALDSIRFIQSKRRGKLRKIYKDAGEKCSLEYFIREKGMPFPEECITNLADIMTANGIRANDYLSAKMFKFIKNLYESGTLDVAILSQDNSPVACSFIFSDEKNSEYIEWIVLYRDKSWNVTLCLWLTEYFYSLGKPVTFNFARGIYDYKMTNFRPDVKALFCLRIAKTRWGHIRNMLAVAIHYAKPVVKSFLRR